MAGKRKALDRGDEANCSDSTDFFSASDWICKNISSPARKRGKVQGSAPLEDKTKEINHHESLPHNYYVDISPIVGQVVLTQWMMVY